MRETYTVEKLAPDTFHVLRADGTVAAFVQRRGDTFDVVRADNGLVLGYTLPSLGDVIRVCEDFI